LGNLAQRSLSMIARNCCGKLSGKEALQAQDEALLNESSAALEEAREAMAVQAIHNGLAAIFTVAANSKRYFAGQAPWALKDSDPKCMEAVLYTTAEALRRIAILCQPFMPDSAERLLDLLAIPRDRRLFAHVADAAYALAPGTELPAPQPVFPR